MARRRKTGLTLQQWREVFRQAAKSCRGRPRAEFIACVRNYVHQYSTHRA